VALSGVVEKKVVRYRSVGSPVGDAKVETPDPLGINFDEDRPGPVERNLGEDGEFTNHF
jgi:hypothetical protein